MKTRPKMHAARAAKRRLTVLTVTLPPAPPKANARRVQQVRQSLGMSQAVFAAVLNVSIKLVQGWEQGLRRCGQGELRMLELMEKHPALFQNLVKTSGPRR
ncbi:MAG: hypothetical protein HKL95_08165 [Phycisphaerae bacterium]|nr:hypothetical protein [Phycisphaerae bacterium]